MRLDSKTTLVTGAARGIGEAIARSFAAEGSFVVVTDINDERGHEVARSLGDHGCYIRLDVRNETDWESAMHQIHGRRGGIDILVNNAGITGFEDGPVAHDPENASLEDWRAVHTVNLEGVFLGCKYGIRAMRAKGSGSIINISSRSGLVGIPRAAAYASSKAAVRNHTKSVALYCAEEGLNIRCNSIHPAAIMTPMWEPMLGSDPEERKKAIREFVKDCPAQRFGESSEVAALALLLASDEASYINGTEITIDGGLLAGSAVTPKPNG